MLKKYIISIISIVTLILLILMLFSTNYFIKENFILTKFLKIFVTVSSFIMLYKLINTKKIKPIVFLVFILLLSFGIRLFWVFEIDTQPYSDFEIYYNTAKEVANGNLNSIYDNIYYQYNTFNIGFTLCLSILLFFFKSLLALKFFNVIISTLIVLYIYKISKLIGNESIARITALLVTFYLPFIVYTTVLTNQTISILFVLISLYYFYKGKNLIIVGVILSVAQLMRPTAIVYLIGFVVFIILKEFLSNKSNLEKIKNIGLKGFKIIASFYIIIVTVSSIFQLSKISKFSLFHNPVPSYRYLVGLNHESIGKWNRHDGLLKISDNFEEKAKLLIQERIKDKKKVLILLKKKFKNFWGKRDVSVYWAISKNVDNKKHKYESLMKMEHYFYYTLLLFSLIGNIPNKKNNNNYYLFYILIFGFAFIYLLTEIQIRYRYEIYPLFIFMAGRGVFRLNEILKKIE